MKFRICMVIFIVIAVCAVQAADFKAIVLYDTNEVANSRDWFGVWHLKPAFNGIGIEYNQSSVRSFNQTGNYDMYICYFEDDKIDSWDKLYSILLAAYQNNKKIFFLGNLGAYYKQGKILDFNNFNRVFNFAGVEDRNKWTDDISGIRKRVDMSYFTDDFTETDIEEQITSIRYLRPFHDNAKAIVEASAGGTPYTPVVITPRGGVALFPFLVIKKGKAWKVALDFAKFFVDALNFDQNKPAQAVSKVTGTTVARKAYVLYHPDPGESQTLQYNENIFRRNLQLFLNYHGYSHEYIDYTKPDELLRAYNADIIVCAFTSEKVQNYDGILKMIVESRAKKYLFFGRLPLYDTSGNSRRWDLAEKLFRKFGIEYERYGTKTASHDIRTAGSYYPFEESLPRSGWTYGKLKPASKHTEVLSVTDSEGIHIPFFFNEGALFAIGDFLFTKDSNKYHFNLFEVFGDFLQPDAVPLYTTGYGYRLAFSHIDGDGLMNSRLNTPDILGVERIHAFLAKTNFPVSASFIVDELMLGSQNKGRLMNIETAKALIALPHIELASHTVTHPYKWEGGDGGDVTAAGYSIVPVDVVKEVTGGFKILEDLLGTSTNLLFFSGDCRPTEKQLRYIRENNVLAINGGDTVYDKDTYNLFNVSPPYVMVGDEMQIFTGAANENILTNLWTKPLDGFRKIISTFENTGSPYVVAPIDIYYHFYSGAPLSAFEAVQDVYRYTLNLETSPVFTSEYIKIMKDWYACDIIRDGNVFSLYTNGDLRAVKIRKQPSFTSIDLVKSKGLLGYYEDSSHFYVNLDSEKEHRVVFSSGDVDNPLYIQKSSHGVEPLVTSKEEAIFQFDGYGSFNAVIAGLNKRWKYSVNVYAGKRLVDTYSVSRKTEYAITNAIYGDLTVIMEKK